MPARPTSPAREAIRGTVPKLAEISDTVIYGEVWERPGLSKRDRSLITVATLLALGREKQLDGHLARALQNGVTREEIGELITHLAFYAGWPAAMTAALVAKEVFEQTKRPRPGRGPHSRLPPHALSAHKAFDLVGGPGDRLIDRL